VVSVSSHARNITAMLMSASNRENLDLKTCMSLL